MADKLDLQGLINASTTGVVFLPRGAWEVGTVVLPCGVRIVGAGPNACKLWGHFTQDTDEAVCLEGFLGYPLDPVVPGFHIPASRNPGGNRFVWLYLDNYDVSMRWEGGHRAVVDGCCFTNWRIGLDIANAADPDQGDSVIAFTTFDSARADAWTPIHQTSSGGLRLIGNKFLRGDWAYIGEIDGKTSDLIVVGNSCENHRCGGLHAEIKPGGDFSNIAAAGNQFAGEGMTLFDFPSIQRVEQGVNVANCPAKIVTPPAAPAGDSVWDSVWLSWLKQCLGG